jgi:hypothetical protein
LAVLIGLAFASVMLVPLWSKALFGKLSSALQRQIIIGFLWSMLSAYLIGLALAVAGVLLSLVRLTRSRQPPPARRRLLRNFAVCLALSIGMALMELGAAARLAHLHRESPLPHKFPEAKAPGEIHVVVIGESSAMGHPYDPNFSVGQIVAWQLERVFPRRQVTLDLRVWGGIALEQAIQGLRDLNRRPDVLLVFAGHNEFQARVEWSASARHYRDENPAGALNSASHPLARYSPLSRLILETIDRQRIGVPPPRAITRQLVEHPCVMTEGYEFLRSSFRNQVERLASYCDEIGTIPIIIVPASNDGRTPPYRSVMSRDSNRAERDRFARDFLAARALERTQPDTAERAYRSLLVRQPGFAESHYRLGQLLERSGNWREAKLEYDQARDLDGFPMRCPSDFRLAYYEAAKTHSSIILIDGPKLLEARALRGILTFNEFHDPQHPTFLSYLALAQDVLDQLKARGALDWPENLPSPRIDPDECGGKFKINRRMWAEVLERSSFYYTRTAYTRYDPAQSRKRASRLTAAARGITAGKTPEELKIPGVGTKPTNFELDDPTDPN